jgi:membrane fusion protein, multidrug efflux system
MDSEEPTTSPSGPDEPQPRPAEAPRVEGGGRRPRGCFKLAVLGLIGLLFFGGLLVVGILPRINRQKKIMDASQAIKDSVPTVDVITAEHAPATSELALPGNVEAIQTTPVSARTNGYLCRWYADIGDSVKAGQLLAEIDTPEVDQQLQQTRANLAQA